MKLKKIVPILLCFLIAELLRMCLPAYGQKTDKKVVLHGTIKNYRNIIEVKEDGDTAPFQIDDIVGTFLPDSTGYFYLEFPLDRPKYFRIVRNTVFLSPGDKLEVMLDYENPKNATFKGKHSPENTYLKTTLYPKAGSFLEGGTNIMPTISQTVERILHLADQRRQLLWNTKKLSKKFRALENGRIDADILNSIYRIGIYYVYVNKLEGEALKTFVSYFSSALDSFALSAVSIRKDPKLLDIAVYRDMLPMINRLYSSNNKHSQQINDWLLAKDIMGEMQVTNKTNEMAAYEDKIKNIKTVRYQNEVLSSYKKLLGYKGDVATDISFSDANYNPVKLSSFKGKLIYIDIWATWCGPCLKEHPYLDCLRERYKENPNIVFLSLSIDTDIAKWLKYVNKNKFTGLQYVTDLSVLKPYYVSEVPRKIIIDKNFKIFSLKAPAPSDPELNSIIQQLIKED